jgi:hypothetical protein
VIAVSLGLSVTWWHSGSIDIFQAILTMGGVIALHASVDLLNDYWDFKRGIDTKTKRTPMSGGTGVLPEGLLKPKSVYNAGILFLVIGGLIGGYFVVLHGVVIGVILAFAIMSIYFYSTKIVNWGLAEVFVAVKGTLIVMGTYYIQNSELTDVVVLSGIVVGVLSSLVQQHQELQMSASSLDEYMTQKQKLNSEMTKFYQLIEDLEATGVSLKGIDQGLLDFPSRRFDEDVWLCWKDGETEIKFWHDMNSGFDGRKPITVSDESLV